MRDPADCHYCERPVERIIEHQFASLRDTRHRFKRGVCLEHEPRAKADADAWRKHLELEDVDDYNGR